MKKYDQSFDAVVSADMAALGLSRYRRRFIVTNRIAYFQHLLRVVERLRRNQRGVVSRAIYLTYRLRYELLSERMGFSIPLGVFEGGLSIAHRGTIVVNGGAVVGKGCRIHPGVTIGAIRGLAPTIGDNVFIGPSCGIYGDVRIGSNVTLGPHSLVRSDIEEGSTVVSSIGQVLGDRERDNVHE